MKSLNNVIAPLIYLYDNVIDFSKNIIDMSIQDNQNWSINNQDAVDWEIGKKIVGYDDYNFTPSLFSDEKFLMLSKKIFDLSYGYAKTNLTKIDGLEHISIRKYSNKPGFLEIESPDLENSSRKITAILFLNDIDEGGEINFKNFDVSISPKQGRAVIFPSSFAYCFKINKPKSGNSFITVSHFV